MVALLILLCSGCALFPNITLRTMAELQKPAYHRPMPTQEGVALELFFIERRPGDPLLGDALWQDVDQIANLPPEVRSRLRQNGLRVGIAGSNIPYALNALTRPTPDGPPGERTLRQEYQVPSGVTHQFPCGEFAKTTTVQIPTDGSPQVRTYDSGRGVLRCRVERTQSGWAELEVLPEIHHGQMRLRPQPRDEKWDWAGGQEIDPLFPLRFTVELNEGEALVVGAVGDQPQSVGSRFFRSCGESSPTEKLLVIRLAGIQRVAPLTQGPR